MSIQTKFGTANINKSTGYYRITSSKEGNLFKSLHRLIYEEYYGAIPKGYVIHHKDGNKTNNNITNLELLTHTQHASLHNKKENNASWKSYARIIKNGKDKNGMQQYMLRFKDKILKQSYSPKHLVDWFLKNYPLEIIQNSFVTGDEIPLTSYNFLRDNKECAKIHKIGNKNGKQNYGLFFKGKYIKKSINPQKLINWFLQEYPLEIMKTTIPGGI